MKTIVIAYLATGIAFLIVDAIWLSTMADMLYRPLLGDKLAPQFHLAPAVVFYLIYVAGIVFFAVMPALDGGGLGKAALNGAILGKVPEYTELDIRLTWQVRPNIELSLLGRNLLDSSHPEIGNNIDNSLRAIERDVQAMIQWQF